MKRKPVLGILFILAIFTCATFVNLVSARDSVDRFVTGNDNSAPEVSTTIVISQVYSGGGGSTGTYLNDYVELKNISSSPQSLNGLSLMYASRTGNFGSAATLIFALPDVTLQPGQFFLVQTSGAGSGGTAFPVTPDATTTNLSMAAASGKVALVTSSFTSNSCGATATPCPLPDPNIIDLVSWGDSNNAEGSATVNNGTALTATQGSVRKNGGCQDTDNNNNDFDVITAPVPRNSATVAPCGAGTQNDANVDFNGDGKSDWVVTRNNGGQLVWLIQVNGGNASTTSWGLSTDTYAPEDYDGDGKDDIAVWRTNVIGQKAYFFILRSSNNTLQSEEFGRAGDNPSIVGDYDGDGKADVAVFRSNDTENIPCGPGRSLWLYRPSTNPSIYFRYECWGAPGDIPTPGDFDGDGKYDYAVRRNNGGGNIFLLNNSGGTRESVYFGLFSDVFVPGDYDGDGTTDFALRREVSGSYNYFIQYHAGGGTGTSPIIWGGTGDVSTPGDYDGDGKTDIAIWRAGTPSYFFVRQSSNGSQLSFPWGQTGDSAPASFRVQ